MTVSRDLADRELSKALRTYEIRRRIDRVYSYLRSCAVCKTSLPPIDLLCPVCWRELNSYINRGDRLRQPDYPFPVYSLMTWSPENEDFVKPFIYGFKGGRAIAAASRLATIFLSHKQISFGAGGGPGSSVVVQAPASTFDHSSLWAHVLAEPMGTHSLAALRDVTPAGFDKAPDQKRRRQGERANRRFEMREHFAGFFDPSTVGCVSPSASADHPRPPKRIVFADDVITSGATAMAAYMALGDPDEFEVWTLVARPRLAGS